jgi:ribosomal protein S18 acetylase RimI-like enzyme
MSADVRAALEADLDALMQLCEVVQSLHAALYPGDFPPAVDPPVLRSYFQTRLASPTSAVAIAEADRVPVGYVSFDVQMLPATPFRAAWPRVYVHQIVVAPAARRRGIATALMRHVEQRAAAEGIDEIVLNTWAGNVDAQHFFPAEGFTPLIVTLRKKLGKVG